MMPQHLILLLSLMGAVSCKPWKVDPLDPRMSYYLRRYEQPNYEELDAQVFGVPVQTVNPLDPRQKMAPEGADWERVGSPNGEYIYVGLLVVYKNRDYKPETLEDVYWGICGATVLTNQHIMTLCSCVASFAFYIQENYDQPISKRPKGVVQHDNSAQDYDIVGLPDSEYDVWYGHSYFNALEYLSVGRVIKNASDQIKNRWCVEALLTCGKGFDRESRTYCQSTNIAVLKFEPGRRGGDPPVLVQLVPWPPLAWDFYYRKWPQGNLPATVKLEELDVHHISFGLYSEKQISRRGREPYKFYDEFGREILSNQCMLRWDKKLCDQQNCRRYDKCLHGDHCSKAINLYKNKNQALCFCGNKSQKVENRLIGGYVGSPIHGADGIVALAMNEYPDEEAYELTGLNVEGLMFSADIVMYAEFLVPELRDSSKEEDPHEYLPKEQIDYVDYDFEPSEFIYEEENQVYKPYGAKSLGLIVETSTVIFLVNLILIHC